MWTFSGFPPLTIGSAPHFSLQSAFHSIRDACSFEHAFANLETSGFLRTLGHEEFSMTDSILTDLQLLRRVKSKAAKRPSNWVTFVEKSGAHLLQPLLLCALQVPRELQSDFLALLSIAFSTTSPSLVCSGLSPSLYLFVHEVCSVGIQSVVVLIVRLSSLFCSHGALHSSG